MNNLDHQKPGGKSDRNKKKRNKKAGQQARPAPEQAQPESEALYEAMAEPVAPAAEAAAPQETAPAEPVIEAAASVAQEDTAPAAPVERVASFRERMASAMPPPDIAPAKPTAPADTARPAPSPAAAPAAGIQAIANAYRDYTRQSLEDAQTFAEKLSAARSLDKAVEAQTEFARQACEHFADNSRKIRELHRELFWQTFRLPSWPLGRSR